MPPKKTTMSDKEYMEDILLTSKTLTSLYHYATQEAATEKLHAQFKANLNETLDMQHNIYNTMKANGWYPEQKAPPKQVKDLKAKFSS